MELFIMHSLKSKEWKQFMQWWPVTCRHSWSNVLYYGHIRTSSSCIPQPVSWGKSDLFDSTWVRLYRCYIYSPKAVKFFSHMLEKTLGYVTVRISISRSKDGLRAEKSEVVQGHGRLRGLSHSKAGIHSLLLGPERAEAVSCPLLHRERVGGGMRTDFSRNTFKKRNLDRRTTTGPLLLQHCVYISGSRLCERCRWWTAAHEIGPAVCVCVCILHTNPYKNSGSS